MEEDAKAYLEGNSEEDLGALLDRCGHYFAHRIGCSRRGRGNIITLLAQRPDISQKELAEILGVRPASVSELVTKLERKGLVRREKDEQDRRSMRLTLTEAGQQHVSRSEVDPAAPFQTLTPEEQKTLAELLNKLLQDWRQRYPIEQGGHKSRHMAHRHRDENHQMEDEHEF